MDTEGLSVICAGLGFAEEDDWGSLIGYTKSEYCLDNLKDIQRFLRRDDPQRRDVFKQICKWNTVSQDLVPIIEFYVGDRNLVINAVKILVFLTMPIDPASDDVAQQIEYLWDLKAALCRDVTIAAIVSLLETPLENLERDAFTEDDWKLVQLLLTLFRNILAIQSITLQQKASGAGAQFLCLTDRFLELMFQENVMDLFLVLARHVDGSCGYLQEDTLLLLEIFHYIFQGQDPQLISGASRKGSKVNGDITNSVDSLRLLMKEEEEKRRSVKQRHLECHSQFSGTFTRLAVDGSKTLFKGNPVPASGDGLLKVHSVARGPLKKIAWDQRSLSLPKENILNLLQNFLEQFLSGGYNVLMQSICNDIMKERQDIQNTDVVMFFKVAQFVIDFQCQKILLSKKPKLESSTSETFLDCGFADNLSSPANLCGPIAATMNEAMLFLVISKWREAFEGLKVTKDCKSLSAAGSLMKNMIRMLDLVLKVLPEDSKETQTARILLYKLFYDQTDEGLTQFLLNQFRSFDTHKQPRSDLADLLEIIHIIFRLMEKLQARGTLRVSRKSRKGRKKRTQKHNNEEESERQRDEHASPQNDDIQTNNIQEPTSGSVLESKKLIKEDPSDTNSVDKEGMLTSNLAVEAEIPPQHSMNEDEVNDNHIDPAYETEDFSDDNHLPATNEVDFNVSRLVSSFVSNAIIQKLCWLLKYYKSNSAHTNHYIICMLQRFCDDLEMSPMLYQLSLLTTFYDILDDQKSSRSEEYANIVHFLTKFVRKMLKIMKSQPLLFVEILFWKTRKECHCINADTLICDLKHLKKDFANLDNETVGLSNCKGGSIHKNIADSLGDDEVDNVVPYIINNQREEASSHAVRQENVQKTRQSEHKGHRTESKLNNGTDEDRSEDIPSHQQTKKTSKRRKCSTFDWEQEATIKHLYEKFKDHKKCSHMIANALDADNTFTAAQVSRKLRQLGLLAPRVKKSSRSAKHSGDKEISGAEDQSDEETLLAFKERSQRKKSRPSLSQPLQTHDSDDEISGTMFKDVIGQKGLRRHETEGSDSAPLADIIEVEKDGTSDREEDEGSAILHQQKQHGNDEQMEDLVDSGDDLGSSMLRRIGSRRNLKMVIDDE